MSYKRKSQRGSWGELKMKQAISKVLLHELSIREVATAYEVPKSTLARRTANKNKIAVGTKKHLGRFTADLPPEFEVELKEHILDMESRFFGLTCLEVRRLAFQLAEQNGIKHRFNTAKQMAGKKWLNSFLARNKEISVRKPEATSIARATGFNRPAVSKFFKLLQKVVLEKQITGSRIYNCDETGVSTVHQPSKILGKKGKHQIGALTSAERGRNVTVVFCVSAVGHYIPPAFIFPRKRMKAELMDDAPSESMAVCEKSGWMTAKIFRHYLEHVAKFCHSSQENPIILILDGHSSHTKSLEVLEYATDHGVIMISLPPHTTHKMQPLDVAFFKPFNTYYDKHVQRWLRAHPGRGFGEFQVAAAVSDAFGKAGTVSTAVNSFSKCGIWPLNEDIFEDHEFQPAQTTDKPMPTLMEQTEESGIVVNPLPAPAATTVGEDQSAAEVEVHQSPAPAAATVSEDQSAVEAEVHQSPAPAAITASEDHPTAGIVVNPLPAPATTTVGEDQSATEADVHQSPAPAAATASEDQPTAGVIVNPLPSPAATTVGEDQSAAEAEVHQSPAPAATTANDGQPASEVVKRCIAVTDISPVPVRPTTDRRRISRRSMEATILTSSPYKRKLAEDAELRTKKTKRTVKARKEVTKQQKPSDTKTTSKQRKPSKAPARKRRHSKKSTQLSLADDDTPCGYCGQKCNASTPDKQDNDWLKCGTCGVWMHESCAESSGVIGDDDDFVCGECCE